MSAAEDARAFIASMEDEDQVALKQTMESDMDNALAEEIRLDRPAPGLPRGAEVLMVYKVPYLAEVRDHQPIHRFGLFCGQDAPESWKSPKGDPIVTSQRTVVRRRDGTPALKNSGWAHSAGYRTGHYLDVGSPLCGYDDDTMYGEMDLRAQPLSTNNCGPCSIRVARANGMPAHQHRWMDASTFASDASICRCGAKRAERGQ